MRLIPEHYFPLREKPDVSEIRDEINWLSSRDRIKDLTDVQKEELNELIRILTEIQRRLHDEYIYYMKPNPAQMEFIRAICYGRIFQASNKTGKTEILVYDYVLCCMGQHPGQKLGWLPKPPIEARIVCSDFGSGIKLKMLPLCNKLIPSEEIARYDGENYVFHFKNGSLLELKSNEQDPIKFGSVDRDKIGGDEPFRREIFGENQTRLVTRKGCFDIVQTPDWKDKTPWLRLEIIPQTKAWPKAGPTDMTLIRGTYKDNLENLDPEGVRQWIEGLGEAEALVRLAGNFPTGVSILFGDRWMDGVHSHQPFLIPPHRLKFRAIDIGIGCPCVCLWGFIGSYNDRFWGKDNSKIEAIGDYPILYIYLEYYQRGKNIPENADEIKRLTGNEEIQLTFLDPKSGSKREAQTGLTNQQSFVNAGIPTILGAISVEAGLDKIASMMTYGKDSPRGVDYPAVCILTSCQETIKEMKKSTVNDLKIVDAMHCISCLRWFGCANLLENWVGASSRIPGAIYGAKATEEYQRECAMNR